MQNTTTRQVHSRSIVRLLDARHVLLVSLLSGAPMTIGCGSGTQEHPLAKEGISPYEKSKASRDAYREEMLKRGIARKPKR